MHDTSNADKGNANIYFKAIFLSLKGAEISQWKLSDVVINEYFNFFMLKAWNLRVFKWYIFSPPHLHKGG